MTPTRFTYDAHPTRVVFGPGARARLGEELGALKVERALLIASPRLAEEGRALLGGLLAGAIDRVMMHVPLEEAARACAEAAEIRADAVVALGGGSAIGLAKAVARESGLPIVAIPTTFAGSEMTSVWGLTEAGKKRTGRDPRARPKVALYDPELLNSLPPRAAAASGLNAIAHAMEALYAIDADPIALLFAEESARALARSLPRAGVAPTLADTSESLYGAWLAGVCLDRTSMGLHHKLCHVLGGTFALPHAESHAVILPYTARYNRDAAPAAMGRLARALADGEDAPGALFRLTRRLAAPSSLAELGMKEEDLDVASGIVLETPYANPRPVDRASVRGLLADAFFGRPPSPGGWEAAEKRSPLEES
jgi:maleylacetate reductase